MGFPTLLEIKNQIKEPLDLEEESFIEDGELENIIRACVDEAEAAVHNIYEDYFLTFQYLNLVEGQTDINLPDDIYANKIRAIVYNDGNTKREITRYRGSFEDIENIDENDDYQYMLVNGIDGQKLHLLPESRETSAENVKIWYIRQASDLQLDTDEMDIPEALNFIVCKAQGLCLAKENGGIIPARKQADIDAAKSDLIQTLSDRVPDGHTEVIPDLAHYAQHS